MPALQTGINRFTALGIPGQATGNMQNRLDLSMSWQDGAAPTDAGLLFGTLVHKIDAHRAQLLQTTDTPANIAGFVVRQRQSQNGIGFDASGTINTGSAITVMQKGGLIVQCAEAISDDPALAIRVDTDPTSPTVGQLFQATTPANSILISKYTTVVTPSTGAGICEITFSFDYNDSKL